MPIAEPYPGVVVREDGTVTSISALGSVVRSPDGIDACMANKERFFSDLILMSLAVPDTKKTVKRVRDGKEVLIEVTEQELAFEYICGYAYQNFNIGRRTEVIPRTVREIKEAMTGEKEDRIYDE